MVYPPLDLKTVGLVTSLILIALSAACLWKTEALWKWMATFPRSRVAGIALTLLATLWAWLLIKNMDLGEFSNLRGIFLIAIPVAGGLSIQFIEDFLAVRALGMILLLLAEPLLEAAFLKPQTSRLLLVVLAYAMIVKGMFFVGMPYLFVRIREWLATSRPALRGALAGGLAYGALLLVVTLTRFR